MSTVGAGHEETAHATAGSLAHLAHGGDRGGALVALLLLAVAAGDVDHGGGVGGSTTDGADTDADGGAADFVGQAGVATDRCTVTS